MLTFGLNGSKWVGGAVENNMMDVDLHKIQLDIHENFSHRLMDQIDGFAFFALNREGRVSQWNLGALRLTGYQTPEIIGQHLACLFDSREMQLHNMPHFCLGIAVKQGSYENKGWLMRRNGSHFLAHVLIMFITNNNASFAVMAWDLTKNRRAADELKTRHLVSPLDE
jgi:PAS domain S-box-containing protein